MAGPQRRALVLLRRQQLQWYFSGGLHIFTCGDMTKEPVSCFLTRAWGGRQVREQQGQGPNAGRWFCFDDSSVEPWDIANLERDCFGGKQAADYGSFGEATGPAQARPQCQMCFASGVCLLRRCTLHSSLCRNQCVELIHLSLTLPAADWHCIKVACACEQAFGDVARTGHTASTCLWCRSTMGPTRRTCCSASAPRRWSRCSPRS